ncbi:MAG: hypothetical protein MUC50_20950 [Myxococcota bacterium]|jgi:hypothetical protein|nr:hypothetical protein [Myxococcota bacterium]
MPRYVSLEKRASCTVTFRLTVDERRLLEHLAQVLGVSQTDLVRELLRGKAVALGLESVPSKPRPRRGRPRGVAKDAPALGDALPLAGTTALRLTEESPRVEAAPMSAAVGLEIPIIVEHDQRAEQRPEPTVAALVQAFREHFSSRAEGTRRELDEALRFFTAKSGAMDPLLHPDMLLSRLEPSVLSQVRERVRAWDERVARKNLHLTYLRMMLQFGARDARFGLAPTLTESIQPLTAIEVATGLFKGRPPGE